MPVDLRFVIEDHGLDDKLEHHASEIGPEIVRRVNDMLLLVENNVRFVTHRSRKCKGEGKGGFTKSSIKHKLNQNGGMVYADEGIAPWLKWYIEGRGVVVPVVAKFLRFCINEKVIFTKKVKPWKGHNIMKEGLKRSEPQLQQKAQSLGRWLQAI